MRRSGLSVVSETAQGASHDPDFQGSANRANELNPRVAIEVHFDFAGGVDGFSGQYVSDAGRALAGHIGDAFVARNQPRKDDVLRTDLFFLNATAMTAFFLNATAMTALIREVRRVHDYPDSVNEAQGEAIAEGTCAFLGRAYRPPGPSDTKQRVPQVHPGAVSVAAEPPRRRAHAQRTRRHMGSRSTVRGQIGGRGERHPHARLLILLVNGLSGRLRLIRRSLGAASIGIWLREPPCP